MLRQRAMICLAAVGLLGLGSEAGARTSAAHPVKTVNVVRMLKGSLAFVRSSDGRVAILLPGTLRLADPRSTAATPTSGGYVLELDYSEPCNGANVCMVAEFEAQRGRAKPYGKTVKLADGITGAYASIQCAASCSPAAVQWREHGVLYTITATLAIELQPHANPRAVRGAFVTAADQAITAGPR
jgi:hypothetical protein